MKSHAVKFYKFVKRQVISDLDEIKEILAVRTFCETNYKLRTEKGELLQYTITILPAFLIPYGRIQVDNVLQAFDLYLRNNLKT